MRNHPDTRGTIELEEASVERHDALAGHQLFLRLHAPRIAQRARPGQFVHLRCDPALPMRRPMSLMRADRTAGTIDLLYKVVGRGSALLATRQTGERLSVLGPIGQPFTVDPERPRMLLLGGGVGIPPMVFIAEHFSANPAVVMMGSEVPFPFDHATTTGNLPGIAPHVDAVMPVLDRQGIASRLASNQGYAGCYQGFITDLAADYLGAVDADSRSITTIYACGPTGMLQAAIRIAEKFDLPVQVSLEEYMACAVGGCAGCTVRVHEPGGDTMRRVCIDGPVFDGRRVVLGECAS